MRWPVFSRSTEPVVQPFATQWAQSCAAIHRKSFANAWTAGEISDLAARREVLVDVATSSQGAEVFGFAMARVALPEAEILTIAIAPRYRGRGVGRILFRRHVDRLRAAGVKELFLEVGEGNQPALKLYKAFGFRTVGRRPGYYALPDGQCATALVMRADLD